MSASQNLAFSSVKGRRLSNHSIPNTASLAVPNRDPIFMPTADLEWDIFGSATGEHWTEVSASRGRLKVVRLGDIGVFILTGFIEIATNGTGIREFGFKQYDSGGSLIVEHNHQYCKPAASIPTRMNFESDVYGFSVGQLLEPYAAQNSGGSLNAQLVSLSLYLVPDYRVRRQATLRLSLASAQTIATGGSGTPLIWTTESEDPYHWFAPSSSTITFDRAAYIQIACKARFAANSTGDRSLIASFSDASAGATRTISGDSCDAIGGGLPHGLSVIAVQKVDPGDSIEFPVYQNSGSGLDIEAASLEIGVLYLP